MALDLQISENKFQEILKSELENSAQDYEKLDNYFIENYINFNLNKNIDINKETIFSLFDRRDQEAANELGLIIFSNFVKAAKNIIDLKLSMYNLDKENRDDLRRISNNFFLSLMFFEPQKINNALNKCKSEACADRFKDINKSMVQFAIYLNERNSGIFIFGDPFMLIILDQAYQQADFIANEFLRKAFKEIMAEFILCWQGELSSKQLWDGFLDINKYKKPINNDTKKLPQEEKKEENFIEKAHPTSMATVFVISCRDFVDGDFIFGKYRTVSDWSCLDNYGNHYKVRIYSVGASFYYGGGSTKIRIMSPEPMVSAEGEWTGVTLGLGFIKGLTGRILMGKKRSRALVFHNQEAVGARLAISRLKIKLSNPVKKPTKGVRY